MLKFPFKNFRIECSLSCWCSAIIKSSSSCDKSNHNAAEDGSLFKIKIQNVVKNVEGAHGWSKFDVWMLCAFVE